MTDGAMEYDRLSREFERIRKKIRREAYKQMKAGIITVKRYRKIMRNTDELEDIA